VSIETPAALGHAFGDASKGLLPVPSFAEFAIPVVGSSPFPKDGSGYRIPNNRTLAVVVVNDSAATIWVNPGGGGAQGIGKAVRPFTSKTFLTNTDYIGVFVGTPTLGTLSASTQSISMTLSNVPLQPSEIPIQRPTQPGVPQAQISGSPAAQTITVTGVANTIITLLSVSIGFGTIPAGGVGSRAKDGTTSIYEVDSTTAFSPNLGPGLSGSVGNSLSYTIDAAPAGPSTLGIITTQGPI
jgi:hypothetical protein